MASKSPEPQRQQTPSPDESPFELPPVEGLPFSKDSEEARAIREVLEQADSERSARASD
jgi:DNA primase